MSLISPIMKENSMTSISRRDLLITGALAAAAIPSVNFGAPAALTTEETDPWLGLKIGVATYTVRELPIEEAIKAVQRVGLKYISIKNVKNHIDLSHTPEERKQRAKMFRDAGLVPLSVGNVAIKNDEADVRSAFEYARDIGVPTMVCSPVRDAGDLDKWVRNLDKLVKEFDIKLAIHNHGPRAPVRPAHEGRRCGRRTEDAGREGTRKPRCEVQSRRAAGDEI